MRTAQEYPTDNKRSTARRTGSDRRGNERRARLPGGPLNLGRALAVARERRTALRRIELRRGPLDRRAPYSRYLDDSLQTNAVSWSNSGPLAKRPANILSSPVW